MKWLRIKILNNIKINQLVVLIFENKIAQFSM